VTDTVDIPEVLFVSNAAVRTPLLTVAEMLLNFNRQDSGEGQIFVTSVTHCCCKLSDLCRVSVFGSV
jgi:hypothetical protein